MAKENVPVVKFDFSKGKRIFPRPVEKTAVLVAVPLTESGDELPVFIAPEWGGVQVFYGSYYAVLNTQAGVVAYGSARIQWENMHTQTRPGSDGSKWVKTAVPTAYRADGPCQIITLIPTEGDGVREASYTLKANDLIVRQPGGEIQHVKAEKFGGIYFSQAEAEELGLDAMTDDEFAAWAVVQVMATV